MGDDARGFVARLVTLTPHLESLAVPRSLFNTEPFTDAVVSCLPSLQVMGTTRDADYVWRDAAGRQLRSYDAYGYDEATGVKPFRSFVNLLRFDGIDPLFGV